MYRWKQDHTAYSAEELKTAHPDAFEHAREEYAQDGGLLTWRVDDAFEDFTENVAPACGLEIDAPSDRTREPFTYSIGSYNGSDYTALASRAEARITDPALFWQVVRTGKSDAGDYTNDAPRVDTDRRTAIHRALQREDAYIRFENSAANYRGGRGERTVAAVEIEHYPDDYTGAGIDELDRQAEALADALTDWIDAMTQHIARRAMDDVEYDTSPAGFLEAAEANGWTYDERGAMVTPPDDAVEIDTTSRPQDADATEDARTPAQVEYDRIAQRIGGAL